jgi:hypothetical protein
LDGSNYEIKKKKEKRMKRGTKFIILLSAFLIVFVGFNMIASPYFDTLKIGREAGLHIISNYLAEKNVKPNSFPE